MMGAALLYRFAMYISEWLVCTSGTNYLYDKSWISRSLRFVVMEEVERPATRASGVSWRGTHMRQGVLIGSASVLVGHWNWKENSCVRYCMLNFGTVLLSVTYCT